MLFFYPTPVLTKFLLLCVLTTHDASTYTGITAVDAGLRAAHYATYAALTRSGYSYPSARLCQPRGTGGNRHGPIRRASGCRDMALRCQRSRACVGLCQDLEGRRFSIQRQSKHHLNIVVHTQPAVLLASERAYYLGETHG
ncbi:hypothetical protein FS749_016096 [Ceratobasidium sp. UAMH 11750]|nr:hypothetical protein FS749_016096 [Ceratobasidium sp. UAMH 11750]